MGGQTDTQLSEHDNLDGITEQQLKAALDPRLHTCSPVGAQHTANVERVKWGEQWAAGSQPDELQWPEDPPRLSPLSLRIFKQVLFTFPAGTGLSWDGVHPRAMLGLDDDTLYLWMVFFEQCERHGGWPKGVGVVVVVLLPKAEGGFRLIGLIPPLPGSG